MSGAATPRFYDELAHWWPLFSPPSHYGEEAEDLLARLGAVPADASLLELGSGGGSLASHLTGRFRCTLTDLSEGMLAVNRQVNPSAEHHQGDMRSLRLGRTFDVVLVHDAIAYATTEADVIDTLRTAAVHCGEQGVVAVLPDYVRETFQPDTDCGGEDGDDGRAFRYLEWIWDPDPLDHTYVADYAFTMREPDGSIRVEHDRHVEGLFSRAEWASMFAAAGLLGASSVDPWNRDVFIARLGTPSG